MLTVATEGKLKEPSDNLRIVNGVVTVEIQQIVDHQQRTWRKRESCQSDGYGVLGRTPLLWQW